jgi:hypothetical protein
MGMTKHRAGAVKQTVKTGRSVIGLQLDGRRIQRADLATNR